MIKTDKNRDMSGSNLTGTNLDSVYAALDALDAAIAASWKAINASKERDLETRLKMVRIPGEMNIRELP